MASPADTPGLFGALSNNGKITTDGVDLTVDYRHNLGTFMGTPAKIASELRRQLDAQPEVPGNPDVG